MVANARAVLKQFDVRGRDFETRQAIMSSNNDQPYLTTFFRSGVIHLEYFNTVIFAVSSDSRYQMQEPALAQHGGANVFVRYSSFWKHELGSFSAGHISSFQLNE